MITPIGNGYADGRFPKSPRGVAFQTRLSFQQQNIVWSYHHNPKKTIISINWTPEVRDDQFNSATSDGQLRTLKAGFIIEIIKPRLKRDRVDV